MRIVVPMPKEAYFKAPKTWEELLNVVEQQISILKKISYKAFYEHDHLSWVKIQHMLYHWNCETFHHRVDSTDLSHNVKILLRNFLVNEEIKSLQQQKPVELSCKENFSVDKAIHELYHKASTHPINSHPFLIHMQQRGLSKSMAKLFIDNWNTDSYIFHLYIAAQSLSTPFELRGELYHNLYEELGEGNIERAHPTIYNKNYKNLGNAEIIVPLVESLHVFNTQVYYTLLCGRFEMGLGGLGFIEVNVPAQMQMIYEGLKKSGIPDADLEFWPLHISLDSEHGAAWFDEMRKVITTPEAAEAALQGGIRVLDARARMLDGLQNANLALAA